MVKFKTTAERNERFMDRLRNAPHTTVNLTSMKLDNRSNRSEADLRKEQQAKASSLRAAFKRTADAGTLELRTLVSPTAVSLMGRYKPAQKTTAAVTEPAPQAKYTVSPERLVKYMNKTLGAEEFVTLYAADLSKVTAASERAATLAADLRVLAAQLSAPVEFKVYNSPKSVTLVGRRSSRTENL